MSKTAAFIFLILSGFLFLSPLILEVLLYNGVLHEYGSTIEERRSAYGFMMLVGACGMGIATLATMRKPKTI